MVRLVRMQGYHQQEAPGVSPRGRDALHRGVVQFMNGVYLWMMIGVGITAAVAWGISQSNAALALFFTPTGMSALGWIALLAPLAGCASAPGGEEAMPEPGVSETLAQHRAARVSDVRYDVAFRLPEDRQDAVAGRVTVTFDLSSADEPLAFDFAPGDRGTMHRVTAGGRPLDVEPAQGHLVLPASVLRTGENVVSFEFDARAPRTYGF